MQAEHDAPPTGRDRTTIVFSTPDERGALRAVLTIFDEEGINLTRIESRPSQKKAWEYVFFIDMLGHVDEPHIKQALDEIGKHCNEVKVLGSFPHGELEE